ncbi:MAG: SDR family NAD(P)-dependent oxidoreductase [Acidobacteria bacterium]|nr:SDR family NAD(P)-dependent oxidoreductase [Acidobacteriota bacterium]
MSSKSTALVTGATSGLGFETAVQLAEAGYDRVTITGRTEEKAADAKQRLEARTGRAVFEPLTFDLGELATVEAASDELKGRGTSIDVLILNAGLVSGKELVRNEDGVEQTFAPLIGHHLLTMRLIENQLLADDARIVIAGSEAARGDVPFMEVIDLPEFAGGAFDGDLEAAADAVARQQPPVEFKRNNAYADAKQFGAMWAGALARRLPDGSTVNAVSPGATPETSAGRHQGFMMQRVMLPLMTRFGGRVGLAHDLETGAGRYVGAIDFDDEVSGRFFASAPKKMTGPLQDLTEPRIGDQASQEAVWNVIVGLAGGVDYPET